jgi:hypothetical protein
MPPVPDWLNDWWEHDHCKPPEFCYHPSADREYLLRKMCTIPGDSAPRRDMYRIDDYRNRIAQSTGPPSYPMSVPSISHTDTTETPAHCSTSTHGVNSIQP